VQGLLQVISLMLALGGFGVDEDAKAPSADTVLKFTVEDADVVIQADLAAVAPRNYDLLVGLPDNDAVKANPDLLAMAKKVKANVEGIVSMGQQLAGVDIVHDVTSVTVFVDVTDPGTPMKKMVVARGSFPKDLVAKIAKVAGGTTGTIDGRDTLEIDSTTFVGMAKDGSVLVGPADWVKPRVADDWKAPKRKKGTGWATIAKYLDDSPFLLVAGRLEDDVAAAYARDLGAGFVSDLLTSHDLAVLSLRHDGMSFYWKDKTKDHLARMALAVDGTIDLMRAAQIAPRGAVELLVAALPSYQGTSDELDKIIAKKDDLIDLVDGFTGDGKFKATVKKDAKAKTITVEANGKKLSDVLPVAVLVPGVVAGLLFSDEAKPAHVTTTGTGKKAGNHLKPLHQN
jgi:hypothetical protein